MAAEKPEQPKYPLFYEWYDEDDEDDFDLQKEGFVTPAKSWFAIRKTGNDGLDVGGIYIPSDCHDGTCMGACDYKCKVYVTSPDLTFASFKKAMRELYEFVNKDDLMSEDYDVPDLNITEEVIDELRKLGVVVEEESLVMEPLSDKQELQEDEEEDTLRAHRAIHVSDWQWMLAAERGELPLPSPCEYCGKADC
jgi:hypothetical protein